MERTPSHKIEEIKNQLVRGTWMTYDQFQTYYARPFQEEVNRILRSGEKLSLEKVQINLWLY